MNTPLDLGVPRASDPDEEATIRYILGMAMTSAPDVEELALAEAAHLLLEHVRCGRVISLVRALRHLGEAIEQEIDSTPRLFGRKETGPQAGGS